MSEFVTTSESRTVTAHGIFNKNYTRDELAEATSKTVRTVQRVLDSLKSKNLIERVGSDKSGYWKIL